MVWVAFLWLSRHRLWLVPTIELHFPCFTIFVFFVGWTLAVPSGWRRQRERQAQWTRASGCLSGNALFVTHYEITASRTFWEGRGPPCSHSGLPVSLIEILWTGIIIASFFLSLHPSLFLSLSLSLSLSFYLHCDCALNPTGNKQISWSYAQNPAVPACPAIFPFLVTWLAGEVDVIAHCFLCPGMHCRGEVETFRSVEHSDFRVIRHLFWLVLCFCANQVICALRSDDKCDISICKFSFRTVTDTEPTETQLAWGPFRD